MASSRKRTIQETEEEPSLLHCIRNQWHFANLCQWIFLFGKVVKIDDNLDTEDIEAECLKPHAPVLQDIGLALLKFLSSHRGLTHELFDEYTRRQYLAKAPGKNPFGDDELALRFVEFDVLTKIRILQQMTQWVMLRPERVREKMEEQKDIEQASWRIEPIGWDRDDRTYFVLDDNRIYRMTEPAPKLPTPKKKSKNKYGSRSNKRRRVSAQNGADDPDQSVNESADAAAALEDDGLGGMKWECLAVTLADVQGVIASFHKTKDENEKILRDQLQEHLLPILEKQEDSRKRKEVQREKELLSLAKMANAKRSSRLANKAEQQKQEEKAKEEAHVVSARQATARKEEQQRLKIEKERDLRLLSREQRLKDRETRREQHERELSQLSEDTRSGSGRVSERRLQAEIERNKRALQELDDEEDDWIFDCVCGVYGQIDDGTHSVACEKCNVWQHSKCLGISESAAERPEFHFICSTCTRRAEEAMKPRTTIKLKVNRPSDASSTKHEPLQPTDSGPASGVPSGEILSPGQTTGLHSDTQTDYQRPVGDTGTQKARLASGAVLGRNAVDGPETDGMPSATSPEASNRRCGTPSAKDDGPEPATPKSSNAELIGRTEVLFNGKALARSNVGPPSSPVRSGATPAPISPRPGGSSLMATPIISREHGIPGSAQSSFTLPSAEGGLSPTKHSPPAPRPQPPSANKTPALPAVLPPVATLSPSPRQQILTPPVKSTDPARRSLPPGVTPGSI